jgi:hypothetical protein
MLADMDRISLHDSSSTLILEANRILEEYINLEQYILEQYF